MSTPWKENKFDKFFNTVNILGLLLLGIITLFPFYTVLVNSFSPPEDFLFKDLNLWPSKIDFTYYRMVFNQTSGIYDAYKITGFITIAGTAISMFFSILAAYALSKKSLPFRKLFTFVIVIPMYFNAGMVPEYLLVRQLGLIDTVWSLIIPSMLFTYYLLLLRNYFMNIPKEIIESATIDGCSDIMMVPKIVIPLSTAAIATLTLFYAVIKWNTFYHGVLYINKPELRPLQVYLRWILRDAALEANPGEILREYQDKAYRPPGDAIKAANIMAATIPIILVYPFIQKYFVKGVIMGSLKG